MCDCAALAKTLQVAGSILIGPPIIGNLVRRNHAWFDRISFKHSISVDEPDFAEMKADSKKLYQESALYRAICHAHRAWKHFTFSLDWLGQEHPWKTNAQELGLLFLCLGIILG